MKKIFVVVLLFNMHLQAQTKTNDELKTLINKAFNFFPKIKEIENAENISKEKLALLNYNKNPEIGLAASYNYIMPKIAFDINGREIQFAPVHNLSASVGASLTLFDFGRLKSNIDKEKTSLQLAKHSTELAKQELANQVAVIYYNIVFLKKVISIQDSVINYYRENKQLTENKLKNGEALKVDVLSLQANIDQELNKKIDYENNLEKQLNLLEYTTGTATAVGLDFDFDINISTESTFGKNNLVYSVLDDKIQLSKNDLSITKLSSKPLLTLHAASGIKNGYVPDVNDIRFNYLGGLTFALPIDAFGKTRQQVKLQETIVKQNELAYNTFMSNNRKDIQQARTDIKNTEQKIENTKSQIASAKEAEQITSSRYKNGVATYLDIIAAEANLEKANLSKIQNEYQLCLAKLELAKLSGYNYWTK